MPGIHPFNLTSKFILLSEGHADKVFFKKLIKAHKLPKMDMPWPILLKENNLIPEGTRRHAGRPAIAGMLEDLDIRFDTPFSTKGILIAVDAEDNPETTFNDVCDQIRRVPTFGVPSEAFEIVSSRKGRPSIAIMLVPIDGPGSLETLCLKYLKSQKEDVFDITQTYLSTDPINISNWSKEKKDKSRLACMVAATHEKDPTLSLQFSFSGSRKIIEIKDECFYEIRDSISTFCAAF